MRGVQHFATRLRFRVVGIPHDAFYIRGGAKLEGVNVGSYPAASKMNLAFRPFNLFTFSIGRPKAALLAAL